MFPHLTQQELKSALHYDAASGLFTWRLREDRTRAWNRKHAGQVAGYLNTNGYRYLNVNGRRYQAAHLVWLYIHGEMPPKPFEVDHHNRIRSDDRIDNLRLATKAQNTMNRGVQRNNTSSHKGVSWDASRKKWFAFITVNYRTIALGRFDRIEDAVAVRRHAEIRMHGRFAAVPVFDPVFPRFKCHVIRTCTAAISREAA